jgi:hypothetical protein
MHAGECRNLLAFCYPARDAHVGLHDIHGFAYDGIAKAPAREFVLAASYRHIPDTPNHFYWDADDTRDYLSG